MKSDDAKSSRPDSKPHSADYFGDTRDFWWNRDFLELMRVRWNLAAVRNVLDVGCGVGHWTRCLAPLLPSGCAITGVDREPRWIEEARKKCVGIENVSLCFRQGEAERLPFPDNAFDFVTCQTVLIHVKDPVAVIKEMLRVLAPGGLFAVVEPNNLAVSTHIVDLQKPISEHIALLELQMICERGKMNLGEGFNSVGPFIAGWLSELGVEQIESYLSDKTALLAPPYASVHEQAMIKESAEMNQRSFWIWNRDDAHRYFVAGGGNPEMFNARWDLALAGEREQLDAIQRGALRANFASVCLLISGRKKST